MIRWLTVVILIVAGSAIPFYAQLKNPQTFEDPAGRFSIEFPDKWDWRLVSPSGAALVYFLEPKGEAVVVIEREKLELPMAPEEYGETFGQNEVDHIREGQPMASDLKLVRTDRQPNGPLYVIDYSRPTQNQKARERVRQYSRPVGENLYRITCAARSDLFSRYDTIFTAIVATLQPK